MEQVVKEVIDSLQAIAKPKQMEATFHRHPEVDIVMADAGRLKQVLYNYLSNALKFTPPGGTIKVTAGTEGADMYRLDVEDNGVGIAPEDISRLFSEFGQLGESAKSKAGSGLGLAISKHIAEAQGGRVGVHSEVGRGSTFFVVLPRQPKNADGGTAGTAETAETCISDGRAS